MINKILITGGTGFLGGHLIRNLQKTHPSVEIYSLVRNKNEWNKLNHKNVIPIIGDFNDLIWMKSCLNFDVILHTAAIVKHSRRNPKDQINFNVNSTLDLVKFAASQNARMVFISTSGTVGCNNNNLLKVNEESNYAYEQTKSWPYYCSKIEAEKKAIELAKNLNVKLTIFRPPVMLGPEDHKFRSTGNILKFLNKKFPFLIEGNITFCDIRDVSKAIINSIDLENPKLIYNVPGHSMTIDSFFKLCENLSGVKKPKFTLPLKFAYPISVITEELFHRLGKHSPIPDPVVLEMAGYNWDIDSLNINELHYKLTNSEKILKDTIVWIQMNI